MKNSLATQTLPEFANSLSSNFIGIDRLVNRMMANLDDTGVNTGYPPYNLIRDGEHRFYVELAVAGFGEDDLTISVDDGVLVIEGTQTPTEDTVEYLHKGISNRRFRRHFHLADHVEVKSAEVTNGILRVTLEREIPEELKPRVIPITFNK